MMKTDLANGAAFFNVQLLNENGAGVDGGWHDTRHNKVQERGIGLIVKLLLKQQNKREK